jgi:hypothetical protein
MEERAERYFRMARAYTTLSRSTAWRISQRKALPGSKRTLQAYLVACQVPENRFPMWIQAWSRVHAKRLAQREEERRQVERTNRIEATVAKQHMHEAGLVPLDKFPGMAAPWSAVHVACDQVSHYRLRAVLQGTAKCPTYGQKVHADA